MNPRPLIEIDRYGQQWIGCWGENACGTPMQWVPIDLEILDSPGLTFAKFLKYRGMQEHLIQLRVGLMGQ